MHVHVHCNLVKTAVYTHVHVTILARVNLIMRWLGKSQYIQNHIVHIIWNIKGCSIVYKFRGGGGSKRSDDLCFNFLCEIRLCDSWDFDWIEICFCYRMQQGRMFLFIGVLMALVQGTHVLCIMGDMYCCSILTNICYWDWEGGGIRLSSANCLLIF